MRALGAVQPLGPVLGAAGPDEAALRWSALSDRLVWAAIAVLVCAMFSFALYAARQVRGAAASGVLEQHEEHPGVAREPQLVGPVGATAEASTAEASPSQPPTIPPPTRPVEGGQPGQQRWPAERIGKVALSLTVLAALLQSAAVLTRALAVQRPPWGNMYEFSLTGTLLATLVYLYVQARWHARSVGVVVVPMLLLSLGLAITVLYVPVGGLMPVLRSYWLVIHVATIVGSFAAFTVAAAISVLYLLRTSRRWGARLGWLPNAQRLDTFSYRLHAFTFPIYTFAVIAGAIWAEAAWGRYWQWDPKETWAFIVWVIYAVYLHARLTAGWSGRGAAAIALTGYSAFIVNYFVINLVVQGLHSYAK